MQNKNTSGTAAVASRHSSFYLKDKAKAVGLRIGFVLFVSILVRWAFSV